MNNIKWTFIKKLENENAIEKVEKLYEVKLPESYKNIIFKYNGGRPNKDIFNSTKTEELVLESLLSFNINDEVNIYEVAEYFKKLEMIPIFSDPFGNYVCLKNNQVVFWNHETDEIELVAKNFDDFLDSLYSYDTEE